MDVVRIPPPPMPDSCKNLSRRSRIEPMKERTNRAAINISMFVDKPQNSVPRAAIETANWFAPRLPMTLHNRPYNGVKVQTASKYLVGN